MVYSGFDRLNHEFAAHDCQNDYRLYLITDTEAGRVLDLLKTVGGFQNLTDDQVKEIWDPASRRFAENAEGDVQTNVIDARTDWVFRDVELPALLANESVTSINGIPVDQLRIVNDDKTLDLDWAYEKVCEAELARDRACVMTRDGAEDQTRVEWKTTALHLQQYREIEHQQDRQRQTEEEYYRLRSQEQEQERGLIR